MLKYRSSGKGLNLKKNPNTFDIFTLYIKLASLFNKNDETIFFSSSKMISQQNLIIYIENLINFFVEKIVLPVIRWLLSVPVLYCFKMQQTR